LTAANVLKCTVHQTATWTLNGLVQRADPWGEITLTAVLTGPGGTLRVPAYWNGGSEWVVRLSGNQTGTWQVHTECSDPSDTGLHGQTAELVIEPALPDEQRVLYRRGAVQLSRSGKHFEHADGTPFHWLADTWWMLLSERVSWPDGFKKLTDKRVAQGFTLAQIVVGFPPDTTPFDGRDTNSGGSPWLEGYASINPEFFKAADQRILHMIESGLVPVLLGGWGYHMAFMGKERMIAHWRYLVARYAAWPVMWCLAGEGAMPYYLAKDPPADSLWQRNAWPEVARAVRASDPWHRPLTLHPRRNSWDDTSDASTLDFHMIQPGHLPNAPRHGIDSITIGRDAFPNKVIINSEPPYEGHGGTNWSDVQRYSFWTSMLSGAGGYTYGAAGVFQANDRDRPTGYRPDGGAFDSVFWDEAMEFEGAEQVAAGHKLLVDMQYHRFECHPEWASIGLRWGQEAYPLPVRAFAAGIPGECRLIYLPLRWYHWDGPLISALEPGVRYKAAYIETNTMHRHELGIIEGDGNGEWRGPTLPHMYDWLLQLIRA
jgi:hypothetical protein